MSKNILFVSALAALFVGCGTNNKDEPVVGQVYGQHGGIGFGNQCSPRVAKDWNRLIASRCNYLERRGDRRDEAEARACVHGAEMFRHRYPSISCNIAVADAEWGPGPDWRQQRYFEINDFILNDIFQKHGWVPRHGFSHHTTAMPGFPH